MIRKAFEFRIYPDSEQKDKLAVQFGCSRFVYNHYRAVREGYSAAGLKLWNVSIPRLG